MTPAGSVGAAIESADAPPPDAWVTSPDAVEDGPDPGVWLIPDVRDGGAAAEPALVSAVTAAVDRPEAAPSDSSAERDQHTIPTITAPAPAVIANHQIKLSGYLAPISGAGGGPVGRDAGDTAECASHANPQDHESRTREIGRAHV